MFHLNLYSVSVTILYSDTFGATVAKYREGVVDATAAKVRKDDGAEVVDIADAIVAKYHEDGADAIAAKVRKDDDAEVVGVVDIVDGVDVIGVVDDVEVVDGVDSIVAKYREGSADATVPKVQM